jgi:hypothetical protein
MTQDFQHNTEQELIHEAQHGLRGQGAVVEMQRRLKNVVEEQTKATVKLDRRMFWLTVVGIVLAAIQTIPLIMQLWKFLTSS